MCPHLKYKKMHKISQVHNSFRKKELQQLQQALSNSGIVIFDFTQCGNPNKYILSTLGKYMSTSSNGNIFRVTGHLWIHRSPHKGQWRRALMFSLICAWINGWVNNREAGDLRRGRADYDVTLMTSGILGAGGVNDLYT